MEFRLRTVGFMEFFATIIRQLRKYLLFYNSSILDIEHSPYYIALGSTQTHKVI